MTAFAFALLARVTVLQGLFGVAALALRRRPASLRHLIWTIAIVGSLALPLFSLVNPMTIRVLPARALPAAPPVSPSPTTASTTIDASVAQRPQQAAKRTDWANVLLAIWAVGTLAFLLRFAKGIADVRRIISRASPGTEWTTRAELLAPRFEITRATQVRVSDDVDMPFAFGIRHPVIVLPSAAGDWSADRRDAVLMHELAHFHRGDFIMNIISQLSRALYWFHPLAWLASHRVRIEAERASDDLVLSRGAVPSDYAEHLLAIVRSFAGALPSPALAMARRSEFEGRLLSILETRERGTPSRGRVAFIATASIAVLLVISAVSPTASAMQQPIQDAKRREVAPADSTVAALVAALKPERVGAVREQIVHALGEIRDPAAVPALADAARDASVSVRRQVAWALGEIDDDACAPALIGMATDDDVEVRRWVAHALKELTESKPGHQSRDRVDGRAALFNALVAMAKDSDKEVREHAVRGLGELGGGNRVVR